MLFFLYFATLHTGYKYLINSQEWYKFLSHLKRQIYLPFFIRKNYFDNILHLLMRIIIINWQANYL